MKSFIWSNNVDGNNLCFFCANFKKRRFFCTDPTECDPVIICKYFFPLGTPDYEIDVAVKEMLSQSI